MTDSQTIQDAVCAALAAAGVGEWAIGTPATGALPLIAQNTHPSTTSSLTVTCYGEVTEEPSSTPDGDQSTLWQVQVKTRTPAGEHNALAEAARRALVGHHLDWGDEHVARCLRTSFLQGGTQNGTAERFDNYGIVAGR